jgi:hypothetical protein
MNIQIITKDGRKIKLMFPSEDNAAESVYKIIESYAFPKEDKQVFAFSHKMPNPKIEGWEVFIDLVEYERMGLDFNTKVIACQT